MTRGMHKTRTSGPAAAMTSVKREIPDKSRYADNTSSARTPTQFEWSVQIRTRAIRSLSVSGVGHESCRQAVDHFTP